MQTKTRSSLNTQALKADYLLGYTLCVLFLLSVAIASFNGTWMEALSIGLPAVLFPWFLIRKLPTTLVTRLSISISLMIFSALFIQQSQGMSEAHFAVFVFLAFTLFYRDWRPILAAAIVIAAHHVLFNFLQVGNTGFYVFAQGASLKILIIHALSVVFEAGLLIYMAISLNKEARLLGVEPSVLAEIANKIAKGDFATMIELSDDDKTSLSYSINRVAISVQTMTQDMMLLAKDAVEGKLGSRADATKHQGDFRKVVEGVNATLDAVISPLNVTANCLESISKGNIPNKISEHYNGDFNKIKNNINTCIDAINALVNDANLLTNEAIKGNLSKRADASQHLGDFRKIVEGVNMTLDAVITPLNLAAAYVESISKGKMPDVITDTYNGDFDTIKNNLNQCIKNINTLISETYFMSEQHDLGDIDIKIDELKFNGSYQEMAKQINYMVSQHITITKQAMACLEGIGFGDFDTAIIKLPGKKVFINNSIEQIRANLKAVSADAKMLSEAAKSGRVTVRADATKFKGEFNQIITGINNTLDTIVKPIIAVKDASESINSAASEIATGNNDLSQRTEQQASNLEETASSMEELASTVKQNAENANLANQLAINATSLADKGGEVVNQLVATMTSINESALKIEDIISVIDGISFQTNILALNAAVEAARAGEQGRGFAVVADEVRNLAQRSSSAAKEIKLLIADSVGKAAEGKVQVENAGRTMKDVVTSVKSVSNIISEIAAASVEQSTGIDEVNAAITSMDETTQQNAALVEQAAAAAESLLEQAHALNAAVDVFKLDKVTPIADYRSLNSPLRASSF